jgi:hydroxymethylpyrimidine/phosphomethylpyrimidine kinase
MQHIPVRLTPFVLSIAGFDPCGGAGVLADVKTIEQLGCQGMAVTTSITMQSETHFAGVSWVPAAIILRQLKELVRCYDLKFIKIGLVENLSVLKTVVQFLKHINGDSFIIWDPVLKSSSGFVIHNDLNAGELKDVMNHIDLITPNAEEATQLFGDLHSLDEFSSCCSLLIKSMLTNNEHIEDHLFQKDAESHPIITRASGHEKHGSGCVLSAAIAAFLSKGVSLSEACRLAQQYVSRFRESTTGLLGIHQHISI